MYTGTYKFEMHLTVLEELHILNENTISENRDSL